MKYENTKSCPVSLYVTNMKRNISCIDTINELVYHA